jgi:hypothetical protein
VIEDHRVRADAAALGRLALSKREAADALGVSIDFLEEHGVRVAGVACGVARDGAGEERA